MKLEVGMYVRTNTGHIGKIENINIKIIKVDMSISRADGIESVEIITHKNLVQIFNENQIIKSSHNIIDLIEVGDYVNGYKVDKILNQLIYTNSFNEMAQSPIFIVKEEIKEILTKEQYENNVYRIEDK